MSYRGMFKWLMSMKQKNLYSDNRTPRPSGRGGSQQIIITTGIGDDGEEGIHLTEAGTPPAIWARLGILDMAKDMILADDGEEHV